MARSHGRLSLGIWADRDWLDLPMHAQWLYMALISQAEINHAGIVSLTTKRWATLCSDRDADLVVAALGVLTERRFVVVDEDVQQLLVRSFIRNDQVDRQPNTLKNACASILLVTSPIIRTVLLAELQRLDHHRVASMRTTPGHEPAIDVLRRTIADLESDHSEPPEPHGVTPSDGYASDGYAGDPIPRRRAGEGAGEGVGEAPVSRSGELSLGETRPPADIPARCPRCSRLGLADDDPGPPCPACGEMRKTRQRRAANAATWDTRRRTEERAQHADLAARCQASGRCDGIWILDADRRPLGKCDHGLRPVPAARTG